VHLIFQGEEIVINALFPFFGALLCTLLYLVAMLYSACFFE